MKWRLIIELRDLKAELGRSVEELKMLGEVGRAVSSTSDLRAVLSKILTSFARNDLGQCRGDLRYIRPERAFRLVEAGGWDEASRRSGGDLPSPCREAMAEATARRAPIEIDDLVLRPGAPLRDASGRRRPRSKR